MKTLGLIDQSVRDALGATHSAQLLLWSFNTTALHAKAAIAAALG